MANVVSTLKEAIGPGARANKYRVNFSVPAAVPTVSNLNEADVLCKASTFPSMTLGQIEAWNQGRKLVIPGDTVYENAWVLTFYGTESHDLRRDMISWANAADDFQTNTHSGNLEAVFGELSVEQLDSAGNPTAKYTFHNVFVQEVAEISVGDDQADTLIEFDVTFGFTDWVVGDQYENHPEVANPPTGNDISL